MNDSPEYLRQWLVERQGEWEMIGIKLRDLNFINQDVLEFAHSVWRQADARAAECRAIREALQNGDSDNG